MDGDRQKIIIVPGNHDINFPRMFSVLKEIDYAAVDGKKRYAFAAQLSKNKSNFRWSWNNFKLYEIENDELYEERLSEFIEFYNRFYGNCKNYPTNPTQQFDIFDFPELNLVIAGFNSCYLNDPLNRQGTVHPQAFANACEALRYRQYRGRLRVAVWHHSTKGAPRQEDYMDTDFLNQLIEHGYSLGFHGHQHMPSPI